MAILKSSDSSWYQFRLILSGALYIIDIDQTSSSAPSPAWPEYWVLKNSSNGLNYKVYLNTSGSTVTLNVDQTNVSEPGNPYELLFCADDSTNHKISVVNDEGSYVLEINLDPTSLNSISGVSRIATTNKSSQTGTAKINVNNNSASQSATTRLVHPYDSILQASDSNWYRFRLTANEVGHLFKVDQIASATTGPQPYWVLKCADDGLNHKVYPDINGSGEVFLSVDQSSIAEQGDTYKLVYCDTDQNYNKISLVSVHGNIIIQINGDSTAITSISGKSRINVNSKTSITGTASIAAGTPTYRSSQSGTARLIHPYDSILQASNSSWYRFRLMVEESGHVFNIDQIASVISGTQAYWVLTCPDTGLNYKLYLDIDGNNQIFFNVDQTNIAEPGELYKLVYCATDLNYKKVSLVSDEGNIIIQINSDATAITSISGTASILGGTTNRTRQTGIARIQASSVSRITGTSRITKTQTSNISGTARIGIGAASSIQGLARIQASLNSSISGVSRIFGTARSSISGTAKIGAIGTSTAQGIARIQATSTLYISGNSRINVAGKSSISGTANIIAATISASSSISGVSRISAQNAATIAGVARIAATNKSNISGTAKIAAYAGNATISGTAKIRTRNRYKYQITMKHELAGGSITL